MLASPLSAGFDLGNMLQCFFLKCTDPEHSWCTNCPSFNTIPCAQNGQDEPEPLRPVIQITQPFCWSNSCLCTLQTEQSCHLMFVEFPTLDKLCRFLPAPRISRCKVHKIKPTWLDYISKKKSGKVKHTKNAILSCIWIEHDMNRAIEAQDTCISSTSFIKMRGPSLIWHHRLDQDRKSWQTILTDPEHGTVACPTYTSEVHRPDLLRHCSEVVLGGKTNRIVGSSNCIAGQDWGVVSDYWRHG